jgi:hypothetical protein
LGLIVEGMATPSFSDKADDFFLDKAMICAIGGVKIHKFGTLKF